MVSIGKWVVTSAWPYINNVPHLGTLIGSVLSADVFARYLRMKGEDVVFVSGSDEHGTPIEVEAKIRGIEPKELTDKAHEYISGIFKEWKISFNNYTRTENDVHKKFVREFFLDLERNGYIFTKEQLMPYCPNDKIFLPDRFIIGTCPYCGFPDARGDQCDSCGRLLNPEDLINPKCVFCNNKPTFKITKHWFFHLDKLSDKLKEWIEKHPVFYENVKSVSLSWIKTGLTPRSVTRDNKWGIDAPFKGSEGKTIYVWFEALLGYISATIEYFKKLGKEGTWKSYWLDKETKTAFFIGKDNIPFHAIIFPAMLIASRKNYTLPYLISATEYLLYEGQKFSKSRKIGVWADEALEIINEVDYWRFALIRMRPEGKDLSFSWKEFIRIINNELNDDIGNFIHRVLSFVYKNFNGEVPQYSNLSEEKEFINAIKIHAKKYDELMSIARLKPASDHILEIARKGNQYLNLKEPWIKIKVGKEEAGTTLYILMNVIKLLGLMLYPIIPSASEKLWDLLNLGDISKEIFNPEHILTLKPGHKIKKPKPLFKKLPAEFINNINEILNKAREKALRKRPDVLR